MKLDISLSDLIFNPFGAAAAILAIVSKLFSIGFVDAFVAVTWAKIGSLFTAASIFSFTLAPKIDLLPEEGTTLLALVLGALYLSKIGVNYLDTLEDQIDE